VALRRAIATHMSQTSVPPALRLVGSAVRRRWCWCSGRAKTPSALDQREHGPEILRDSEVIEIAFSREDTSPLLFAPV